MLILLRIFIQVDLCVNTFYFKVFPCLAFSLKWIFFEFHAVIIFLLLGSW